MKKKKTLNGKVGSTNTAESEFLVSVVKNQIYMQVIFYFVDPKRE